MDATPAHVPLGARSCECRCSAALIEALFGPSNLFSSPPPPPITPRSQRLLLRPRLSPPSLPFISSSSLSTARRWGLSAPLAVAGPLPVYGIPPPRLGLLWWGAGRAALVLLSSSSPLPANIQIPANRGGQRHCLISQSQRLHFYLPRDSLTVSIARKLLMLSAQSSATQCTKYKELITHTLNWSSWEANLL